MDSYTFFEEETMRLMHHDFIQRFNLDKRKAAELTLEIIEILNSREFEIADIDPLYINQLRAL